MFVWLVELVVLWFSLVLLLNLNDQIEEQEYHWVATFLLESVGTSSAVTILVVLVDTVNFSLGWLQQHTLRSGYDTAMLTQSFFINVLTTPLLATLMCLKGIQLPGRFEFGDNLIPRNVSYLVNSCITMTFLSQLLSCWSRLPARFIQCLWKQLVWPGYFKCLRSDCCWDLAVGCGAHSREMKRQHVDGLDLPAEFPFSTKYISLLYIVATTHIFSPGVPVVNLAAAIALTHQYYADKWVLIRHSQPPSALGYAEVLLLPERVLSLVRGLILPAGFVFAYLWWTLCGPDSVAGQQLSVHKAVTDWTNWTQVTYFGIAPAISMCLVLLGDTVMVVLNVVIPSRFRMMPKTPGEYLGEEGGEQGPEDEAELDLSLIHISEPTRLLSISYAVFCLKKKINNKLQYSNTHSFT
eukprot:TRINITY_DN25494_c0_g1_i1.p1 TRINITY_DN25494_c0_g1~~TRINITY_DN25494_c0_g1_i1.p1  ORF type:complete len:409 (+),score=94.95 TRINITY_DN25494_c0_g1_i1:91-1317(+)